MSESSFGFAILDISQIDKYSGDLRLRENPEYARLERSIRKHGIQQPLVVTQGESGRYVVAAGGNTRLRILKKLWKEDPERNLVPCVVQAAGTNDDLLLAHIRENDLRGRLTFVERALAVETLKTRLGISGGSTRRMARALESVGFPIQYNHLMPMEYAATRLLPVLTAALKNGLGRPAVLAIQRLERAGAEIWEGWGLGGAEDFFDLFSELCKRQGKTFELDRLTDGLVNEIRHAAECSSSVARLALEHVVEGNAPPVREERHMTQGRYKESDDLAPFASDPIRTNRPKKDTGAAVRSRLYGAAQSLADSYGLGFCIQKAGESAEGYVVASTPDTRLKKNVSTKDWDAICLMWWMLRSMSSPSTELREPVSVDCPIAAFGPHFLARMERVAWREFMQLLQGYRSLRMAPEVSE